MGDPITRADLKAVISQMNGEGVSYEEALRAFKREYLLAALAKVRGNQCKAAANLGMHRNTLRRTLTECGVTHDDIIDNRYRRAS